VRLFLDHHLTSYYRVSAETDVMLGNKQRNCVTTFRCSFLFTHSLCFYSYKLGAVVFDRMDGFEFNYYKSNFTDSDPFLNAWRQQGPDQVARLNRLVPLSWLKANPNYYQV